MRSERDAGFTLLEVLAAVAILGVWYVIIATFAMQGLRAQGQSQRRLDASIIADELMAGIESGLARGAAPAEGSEEVERDEFLVKVEVTPYNVDIPAPPETNSARTSLLEEADIAVPTVDLLGANPNAGPTPLRQVRIEVSWLEGFEEKRVVRDSFAFDRQLVQEDLAALEESLRETTQENRAADQGDVPSDGDVGGDGADGGTDTGGGLRELGEALEAGTR